MHSWLSKILAPIAGSFRRRREPYDVARMPLAEAWQSDFQPEDQFLVSFPRSGNTWLRHLLWELIVRRRPDLPPPDMLALLPTVHHRVPVELQHEAFGLRGRIFKSHNIAHLAGQRMVYLVREPADTLVSYYHYCVRCAAMETGSPVEESLDEFCQAVLDKWCEHLDFALAQHRAHPTRTHFANYAALQHDTTETLRGIVVFLGLEASEALLAEAVERCRFEDLRARVGVTHAIDLDHPFFRKGRAGSGTEELQPATIEHIERIAGPRYRQAAEIAAAATTAR